MSSTITQIVDFTIKEEINFKDFAGVMKSGAKGLRSQMLGVGIEERETRRWILGNPPLSILLLVLTATHCKSGTQRKIRLHQMLRQ